MQMDNHENDFDLVVLLDGPLRLREEVCVLVFFNERDIPLYILLRILERLHYA